MRAGSRTPRPSASPPARRRPKCWSKTSSRRCGGSIRSMAASSPEGTKQSNSACRRNLSTAAPSALAGRRKLSSHQTITTTRIRTLAVSLRQKVKVGAYVLRQRFAGRKRYPLVLMLEPLFRCNLSCFGCGKIDYPDAILNKRLSVQECLDAVDECGAPMVAIPGGEPLIHKEIGEIVRGIVARRKFVSLCTNARFIKKRLPFLDPPPYLFFSVHLDGPKPHHDKSVCQDGVFDRAVSAIRAAKAKGFTVNVNCTIFDGHPAEDIAKFLDMTQELGIGVTISPGYAYERAPDQEHFLNRRKTKELFRKVFALGK